MGQRRYCNYIRMISEREEKCMTIVYLILVLSPWVVGIIGYFIVVFFPGHSSGTTKPHNEDHPGITVNTITGKKDIICPKCRSPYCTYHYEYSVTPIIENTRTKVHLLNPFKPFVEDVTTYYGGNVVENEKYRCMNCGKVFR